MSEGSSFSLPLPLVWYNTMVSNSNATETSTNKISVTAYSGKSLFLQTSVVIVIGFWLKWAGYLAVAGLNLLAQISDRISPFGV